MSLFLLSYLGSPANQQVTPVSLVSWGCGRCEDQDDPRQAQTGYSHSPIGLRTRRGVTGPCTRGPVVIISAETDSAQLLRSPGFPFPVLQTWHPGPQFLSVGPFLPRQPLTTGGSLGVTGSHSLALPTLFPRGKGQSSCLLLDGMVPENKPSQSRSNS